MSNKIAVKDVAIFVYNSGDLTNEFFSNKDLEEGSKAHSYLQAKYNEESNKEVYIKLDVNFNKEDYTVHGFIDGVLNEFGKTIIEEIKSTKLELEQVTLDYHLEYLAQLKLYSYIFASNNNLSIINARLTYISVIDYKTKSFDLIFNIDELERFFLDSIEQYLDFKNLIDQNLEAKMETIKTIKFPFKNMRAGQRDLMKSCYQTMRDNEILYAIAPTGIGKTIATIFSSLKALNDKSEKLFYLTAKGMGKTIAVDSLKLLQKQGLKMKSLVLTAKAKSCLHGHKICDPEKCIYAKGFFNRLQGATKEILEETDIFDFETVTKYALKHQICSFEFSLYLSYFCDFIIADYNYVFDPRAHLIRYFENDEYKPKILIDEAHNLISRSKDMFSSRLSMITLYTLRKYLTGLKPVIRSDVNVAITLFEGYIEKLNSEGTYYSFSNDENIYIALKKIITKCDQIFSDEKEFKNRDQALDCYFEIKDYVTICELYEESHRFLVKKENEEITISLLCLDASKFILERIKNDCYGVVFFSATLYPMQYHMDLLTKGEGKFIELKSSFDSSNLKIIVNNKISTKYKSRDESIDQIIDAIDILVNTKKGNYIIFFPSYAYLNMVVDNIIHPNYDMLIQKSNMDDVMRDEYFLKFKKNDRTLVGFFVLGGVFAEGLDFIGDLLSGAIIVGVGIPQVCLENNLLKDYFDDIYEEGFDYAYTYPGFNRVVQACGRVIRSEDDKGILILMDERYGYRLYQSLMPTHWTNIKQISNSYDIKKEINDFWRKNND